jgi:hypothetical protein
MSGRKQHYLPQFLQRPFSHREKGGYFYVHVHEKYTQYSPNTSGVGAKRDFYSGPDNTTADDNLTKNESRLSASISEIISSNNLPDAFEVARLVSALSIRTLKIRNAIADLAPKMLEVIKQKVTSESWISSILDGQIIDKKKIDKLVDQELLKLGKTNIDRNKLATLKMQFRIKATNEYKAQRELLLTQCGNIIQDTLSTLIDESAKIADNAFVGIFEDPTAFDKRDQLFNKFSYQLIISDHEEFILGDCAVVAIDKSGSARLAMADIDDDIVLEHLYLPISPKHVIHGSRFGNENQLGISQINDLSAKLSNQFFISYTEDSTEISKLKTMIGAFASPIVGLDELYAFAGDTIVAP